MRISKFSSAICAVAVCASFISARADDTPTQAAARAALEQKMQQLDAQPAATNAEVPPPIVVTASGATQEQSAPTTPAPVETQSAAAAPVTLDTNTVPTAEMIQRSMMPLPGENQPTQPVQTPAPAVTIAPAPAETIPTPAPVVVVTAPVETPAPVVVTQTPPPAENPPVTPAPEETNPVVAAPAAPEAVPATSETTPTTDTDAQTRAMKALQQKMSELDKQPAVTPPPAATEVQPALAAPVQVPAIIAAPETKPVVITPTPEKPANVNYPGKQLGLTPIEAPPLPISPGIEAQLRALDAKYKADQISPKDYFQQREEILKGQ